MLFAMLATIEKIFIEVARKIICEILTAAASAFVGHLIGNIANVVVMRQLQFNEIFRVDIILT